MITIVCSWRNSIPQSPGRLIANHTIETKPGPSENQLRGCTKGHRFKRANKLNQSHGRLHDPGPPRRRTEQTKRTPLPGATGSFRHPRNHQNEPNDPVMGGWKIPAFGQNAKTKPGRNPSIVQGFDALIAKIEQTKRPHASLTSGWFLHWHQGRTSDQDRLQQWSRGNTVRCVHVCRSLGLIVSGSQKVLGA
jgi:hypothetical protein